MNLGRTVFSQLLDYLPSYQFQLCVDRYQGDRYVKELFLLGPVPVFGVCAADGRESLRDIEACLRSQRAKLYHMGFRGRISRNTLAHANEKRHWRHLCRFRAGLIAQARQMYRDEPFAWSWTKPFMRWIPPPSIVFVDVSLGAVPSPQKRGQGARAAGPARKHSDQCLCDQRRSARRSHSRSTVPEAGAFYLLDRGYLDFARLYVLQQSCAFFITRAKHNTQFWRRDWRPVRCSAGVRSDQIIQLTGPKTAQLYPDPLRRIHYFDAEKDWLIFLTNNFQLPALTIADLYRARWDVELFFRWIKQHLTYSLVLWHFGKRGQDSNLGGCHRVRARGHGQKTVPSGLEPLQNPADFKHHTFRENPAFIRVFQILPDKIEDADPCTQLNLFHL